jgi:hypothetical protein
MPSSSSSSHRRNRSSISPYVYNPISSFGAVQTRRAILFILGLWFGGILLIALSAPAAFRAVDGVLAAPPPQVAHATQLLGTAEVRDLLRYQIAEANRSFFELWGTIQFALGIGVLLLLLFFSHAGKPAVGLAALMLVLAAVMKFLLIPRIAEITRRTNWNQTGSGQVADQFQVLHGGFSAFQMTLVLLGSILLFLLFRRRTQSGDGDL